MRFPPETGPENRLLLRIPVSSTADAEEDKVVGTEVNINELAPLLMLTNPNVTVDCLLETESGRILVPAILDPG